MNNADLGITIQKFICDYFSIQIPIEAKEQFTSNYNKNYISDLNIQSTVVSAFDELGVIPQKCVTYTNSENTGERYNPNNFILMNGKTLSVRTSKFSDKIAPRVVGQAGIETFNYHFNQFTDKHIEDKQEIKSIVYNNIHKMLPIFFDYLFISDFTIWFQYTSDNQLSYTIFDKNQFLDLEFDRSNFTFTKDLDNWKESTTLKYKNKSIAEIQIHKNRTFKFRFIMKSVIEFLKTISLNTETFGMTAEKTICDVFNLDFPSHLVSRTSRIIESQIKDTIIESFLYLPKPIKYTGSEQGFRKAESKCPYDFLLKDNLTLSLKTNTGNMVCPPEVGQPSSNTCYLYFKHLCDYDEINEISFKEMVYKHIDKMLSIYANHLFDSDYLLWIYQKKDHYTYTIFPKNYASNFEWNRDNITFTKKNIKDWNESNTVKYNDISIGEFQVHKNRNCYKFRFNLTNLIKIIK